MKSISIPLKQLDLTVVVGGGAAGICAAISKARRGEPVLICEKTSQLGKKVLATGNGRCNLLNDDMGEANYNPAARNLVRSVFARFGKGDVLDFFRSLGLEVYSQEDRIFPRTNQASSVLKVLESELQRLAVPVEYGFECSGLSVADNGLVVLSQDGRKIECRHAVLTGGGKTYPAFGSDGSMYNVASHLGHSLVTPVPSAVPLVVRDNLCHMLQGQRIVAGVSSVIEGRLGPQIAGELLFTKYGLSGTCILDVSEEISVAMNRLDITDVSVAVDMVPFMDRGRLRDELRRRSGAGLSPEEMLVGILPNKLCTALKGLFEKGDIEAAVGSLKDRRFKVSGTRGWNEAEFTCGGVNVDEIGTGTLESKLKKDVYFAGELLDVNGRRGGYNLGWAWASGFVAGLTGSE